MRVVAFYRVLQSTAAVSALAIGSTAAQAQCTRSNTVVTCHGATASDQVNSTVNQSPPPSVSLVIAQSATVTRSFSASLSPNNPPFIGAIGYTNSGTVGTTGANVDFNYFGSIAAPTNTFTFDNRGTQNGGIFASNVGGAISGTNSGTVTRGIDLRGAGPISFTNTGNISTPFGTGAVTLLSSFVTFETGPNNLFRRNETGGAINATIDGTLGVPATATTAFRPQGIFALSVGSVDLTVNGRAGSVSAASSGNASESTDVFTSAATTRTSVRTDDQRSLGSNARVTIGAAGRVDSVSAQSFTGTAAAVVNGTVDGNSFGSAGVVVSSSGTTRSSRSTDTFSSSSFSLLSSDLSQSQRSTGGAASAEVSSIGRVAGSVSATSNAGAATVRIAGQVGNNALSSSVAATSTGTNSSSRSQFASGPDGSSESSSSSITSSAGGAASVTVAATGSIFGGASATGDGSVSIDNAGRIRGDVRASSNGFSSTAFSGSSFRTDATSAAGVRTQVSQSRSSQSLDSVGGTASITNVAGATMQASVQASSVRGTTFENAGSVRGGVLLSSFGSRAVSGNNSRTTLTIAPAAGGGTTTTFVEESAGSNNTKQTGGAVTATYGGTVGVAQVSNFNGYTRVEQNAATVSTATITGSMFADFSGRAGGEDRDTSNTFNSRQVTQSDGSLERERSTTSRETFTQIASTSSLTIASTGRIADNGSGTGNVSLSSFGGDAVLTLDGGQIDGNVNVVAAVGRDFARASGQSTTFTRGPTVSNRLSPEVQQNQVDTSTSSERQAPGSAVVIVNSGRIGGDLYAGGNGTGASSLGVSIVMNGTVAGGLAASSSGANERSDTNSVTARTGPSAVTRTTITNSLSAPSETGGGVLVAVGGTVGGGIFAGTDVGASTVNLTGSVGSLNPDGVSIQAFDFTTQRQVSTVSAGSGFFNLLTTSSTTTSASTLSGGAATLNVAAGADLRNAGASSLEGDIFIQGFGGSVLNIAAGSRIVQTTGDVALLSLFGNSTSTVSTASAGFSQTGSTSVSTSTLVGGPAFLTNAGVIGSAANAATIELRSIAGVTLANSGTINGLIIADATFANRSTTTTVTDASNVARRRSVSTNAQTAVGGAAQVNNASLVTGGITAIGATGSVTNSGVIRGGVTVGGSVNNFSTTTTITNTVIDNVVTPVTVISPSVPNTALFTQTYTVNQNGLLLGGVNVTGTTTVDPSGATIRTSNVNAAVNLNNGSITLGNITAGADTSTNVNLSGSGLLGVAANDATRPPVPGQVVTAFQPTPTLTRFTAIDPALGTSVSLPSGSRVSGVQTLAKTGDGTFAIVGAPLLAGVGTAAPTYTLDVGTLRISGGELQLGLASTAAAANAFGIRGNVENNANLVIGRRITDGAQTAVQGINLSILGNVTNAAPGNLIVGVNLNFVRTGAPGPSGNPFAGTLAPFVAFGPSTGLASTNSFVRVDGNLNLAGTVLVQGQASGLYEPGRAYDLFSVSGSYANTGSVRSSFNSPFVGFTLTPRSEGGRTIVSLDVVRASFVTGARDANSAAAAGALQNSLPSVFSGIRGGSASASIQDLATIVSALDTQLTADQAAQVFRELSSGEFYGSLSAVSTTAPFGEATEGLPSTAGAGIGLWFRPTGQFASYGANEVSGASAINVDNHGGSLGLNYSTGSGGNFGVAGGYGRLDVNSDRTVEAQADTYVIGAYGSQQLGRLHLSAQAVYGSSDWTASRTLPLLGRTATSSFNSDEIRGSLRAAYTIAMVPGIDFSPFARAEVRRYSFDGFTEQGAGAVSLAVGGRSRTAFTPELGARMSGALGERIRPFAEASYLFQGDVGSDRVMSFAGGGAQNFTVEGVDPGESIRGAIGVAADVGAGTIFVRGDYHSGGDQQVGSVRGGLLFNF